MLLVACRRFAVIGISGIDLVWKFRNYIFGSWEESFYFQVSFIGFQNKFYGGLVEIRLLYHMQGFLFLISQ